MANPVIRPCTSCGRPVETRRLTSTPTCSTRCYQRLRRKAQQDKTTLLLHVGDAIITLTGLPPDTDKSDLANNILAAISHDDICTTNNPIEGTAK